MHTMRSLSLIVRPRFTELTEEALVQAFVEQQIDVVDEVGRISHRYLEIYRTYIALRGYVPPEIICLQAKSPIERIAARRMAYLYRESIKN